MKRVVIAIIVLLLAAGIGLGLYFYQKYTTEKKIEAIKADIWKVEEMGDINVEGMTLNNDSLLTDALDALLTKKAKAGKLNCEIGFKISDTKTNMSDLNHMLIKLSNGNINLCDTLSIKQKEDHLVEGNLVLNVAKLDTTGTKVEQTLKFLRDIYQRKSMKMEICPSVGDVKSQWISVMLPSR